MRIGRVCVLLKTEVSPSLVVLHVYQLHIYSAASEIEHAVILGKVVRSKLASRSLPYSTTYLRNRIRQPAASNRRPLMKSIQRAIYLAQEIQPLESAREMQ